MSYSENYTGKGILNLLGILFLLNFILGTIEAQESSDCPMYVYEEPTIEEIVSSYSNVLQTGTDVQSAWDEMDNAIFSDNLYLSNDLEAGQSSQKLTFSNFMLNIPEGATIHAVQLYVEGQSAQAESVNELLVRLTTGDSTTLNLANYPIYGQEWQTDESTWTYGAENYLWDIDWTPAMLNESSFGLELQVQNKGTESNTVSIDRIHIKVLYTPLYTLCDHDCVVFFVDEDPNVTGYRWNLPFGFERLSGTDKPYIINIGKTIATTGDYEICVEKFKTDATRDTCCRVFRVDNCEPSSIGDFVFIDENGNGIQDDQDTGLRGVSISLYDDTGKIKAITNSDSQGKYQFENIDKGFYYLRLSGVRSNYFPTHYNVGSDATDSDLASFGSLFGSKIFYLDPGITKDDIDFGFIEYSSISGVIWEDLNVDGNRISNEPLLSSFTVYLLDEENKQVSNIITDSRGRYSFSELLPGSYKVQVVLNDYIVTKKNIGESTEDSDFNLDGTTDVLSLGSGTDLTAIDLGLYTTTSVGDYVWIDENRDGVQSSADSALSNIDISLFDSENALVGSTKSDDSGAYLFDNLIPGEYYLQADIPLSLFQPTDYNAGNESLDSDAIFLDNGEIGSASFILESGRPNNSIDIGLEYLPASISGIAWIDGNVDGIYTADELPQVGVLVSLYDENGAVLSTTTTDENGYYIFDGLNPGAYQIVFEPVGSSSFTLQDVGTSDVDDSDVDPWGKTIVHNLIIGQKLEHVNAGYYESISIGDYVFLDINRNGLQDDQDLPLSEVTLELYDENNILVSSTISQSNGAYLFPDLTPASYYIQATASQDFIPTSHDQGDDEDLDSDLIISGNTNRTELIPLISGVDINNIDLGFQYRPSSISGFVWEDFNGNGIVDSEDNTIADYEVVLFTETHTQVASTTTNFNGFYEFENLNPESYYVQFILNDGSFATIANAVDVENRDSDITEANGPNTTDIISLSIGENRIAITGGFFRNASVGDFVFLDENFNGIQDENESGLPGVILSLRDDDDVVIGEAVIGITGAYMFENIKPGQYQIQLEYPRGYGATTAFVGSDTSLDSDLMIEDNMGFSSTFELLSGQANTDIDFGFVQLSEISGLAWEDVNYNGLREDGEPVLSEVSVSLWSDDVVIAETTTDDSGLYVFGEIMPGIYEIRVSSDDYFISISSLDPQDRNNDFNSSGSSSSLSIVEGMSIINLDAGFYQTASVGNFVFIDVNRNGSQDGLDIAYPDLKLSLIDSENNVVAETSTDEQGMYSFDNLVPGEYYILTELDGSTIVPTLLNVGASILDSDATIRPDGSVGSVAFSLSSAQVQLGIDLGFQYMPSSISGFTFVDADGDGVKSENEIAIQGIFVSLINSNNIIVATTIVDDNGNYILQDINPGSYRVRFSRVEDLIFTNQNIGGDDADSDVDANGDTELIEIGSGQNIENISAGYLAVSSIGDYVFLDMNKNGIQDSDDPGLADAIITLYNNQDQEIESTTSSSSGLYRFLDLSPGIYYIEVNVPEQYMPTLANAGSNDNIDSDLFINETGRYRGDDLTVASGTILDNQDFGFQFIPSSIRGYAWTDENGNGIREENEATLSDSEVYLLNNIGETIATTFLDGQGEYIFDNLLSGTYSVQFAQIEQLIFTTRDAADDAIDSDVDETGISQSIDLAVGQEVFNLSAGYLGLSSIGDFVFLDTNRDGLQSIGEDGIADINVELRNGDGEIVETTTTDAEGAYVFQNLLPGQYYITIVANADLLPTIENVGTNDQTDSDLYIGVNGTYRGDDLLITSGTDIDTQDFGLVFVPLSISGFTWIDQNANGVREDSEPPAQDVLVSLINDQGNTQMATVVDTDGRFIFESLSPGSFTIMFESKEGLIFTTKDVGDNDALDSDADAQGFTEPMALNATENIVNIAAGYYGLASIGNYVFFDQNRDGLQDVLDTGISDVELRLYNSVGTEVAMTTSDTQGAYIFDNVVPDSYYIIATIDGELTPTLYKEGTDALLDSDIFVDENGLFRAEELEVISSANITYYDFGFQSMPSSIEGFVFEDRNANGIAGENESLISEIPVRLFTADNILVQSTVTDATGQFFFNNLNASDYYIQFGFESEQIATIADAGNDKLDSDITGSNGILTTDIISLGIGETYDKATGGFYKYAELGDFVWNDINENGAQDPSESGLAQVTIQLYNDENTLVNTSISDNNGIYSFTSITPGSYYIEVIYPDGFAATDAYLGGDDTLDSDIVDSNNIGRTDLISLLSGAVDLSIDIGLTSQNNSVISGRVWIDRDMDGAFINDTELLSDVTINLYENDGTVISNTISNNDGTYVFQGLAAGNYYVEFIDLLGGGFTQANAVDDTIDSDVDNSNGSGTTATIVIATDQMISNIDAGLLPIDAGTIIGQVWNDTNSNGVRENGEPSISGVLVQLMDSNGNLIREVQSDDTGAYTFNDLNADTYYIKTDSPVGFSFSAADQGNNDTVDSDITGMNGVGTSDTFILAQNQLIQNMDIGLVELANASIEGRVWSDQNSDGLRSNTEQLVPAVNIRLLDNTGVELQNTTSDSNGAYTFDQLSSGQYYIVFESPANFDFTTGNVGSDDTIDSDVTNENGSGSTAIISIVSSQKVEYVDAGLVIELNNSISGLVWLDNDGDGIRDTNESTVADVVVSIYNLGAVVSSTVTDANGSYQFNNLTAGLYNVEFVDPQNRDFTLSRVGNDATIDSDVNDLDNGIVSNVFLLDNDAATNIDAGLLPVSLSSISGRIWIDSSREGVYNPSETGYSDLLIRLFNDNNDLIASTTTDTDGAYIFDNLSPTSYYVQVTVPTGYEITTPDVGSNDTIDSDLTDANGSGTTDYINVDGTQSITSVDGGLRLLAESQISGFVFEDTRADGIRGSEDSFIAGIEVSLFTHTGSLVSMTTTDASGMYVFNNTTAGDYYVTVNIPSGAIFTQANIGFDTTIDSDVTELIVQGSTEIITIVSGQLISNIDAGYYIPGSITGVFFFDQNQNGTIDFGDQSLTNETIILEDAFGNQLETTVTNSLGIYSFDQLQPGDHRVLFPISNATEPTIANASSDELFDSDIVGINNGYGSTETIEIISGQIVQGVNGGIRDIPQLIAISGTAWEDINGDGQRATTDPALSGYSVSLFDATGNLISTRTTAFDGTYTFDDLPSMAYYVVFDLPDGQGFTNANVSSDSSDSDVTGSQTAGSTDIISTNLNSVDAGYYRYASVGDKIFNDSNANGLLDNAEVGINSLRIRLYDEIGALVATTFSITDLATGQDGYYQFSDLSPGDYYIKVDPASGMFFTDPNIGNDDTIDSDINSDNGFGTTSLFTLSSGETNVTIDAGLLQDPADVGDRVWIDFDGDGVQDIDEPGLNDTQVDLYDINGNLVTSTITITDPNTLENGFYSFNNIQPGAYYLVFTPPTGYLTTIADQGGNDATDSDITSQITQGSTNIINLSSGENDTDIDAGFYIPASIGDFVFHDINQNGIQDNGESGVADVLVSLRSPTGSTLETAMTDNTGLYTFGGLQQGVYFVSFQLPDGFVFTQQDATADDLDSDASTTGNTPLISLAHGVTFNDLDAGIYEASSLIGSRVWYDLNKDGIQTFNEGGVEDVPVSLFDMSGSLVETTFTDFDGEYLFFNVPNGDYQVRFVAPENMAFTVKNVGTDSDLDSDADASGMTNVIQVNNTYDMHIDAGMYPIAGINGIVYNDENANRLMDINEPDLSDVKVELLDITRTSIATTITSEKGTFSFSDVQSGEYMLRFELDHNYLPMEGDMTSLDNGYYEMYVTFDENATFDEIGFYEAGMIKSNVWMDINMNNAKDEDEHGLTDIVVLLKDHEDNTVDYQVTDEMGQVQFDLIPYGHYYIQFEIEGQVFAQAYQTSISADSDVTHAYGEGTTSIIEIMPSTEQVHIDAGIHPKMDTGLVLRGQYNKDHNELEWSQMADKVCSLQKKHRTQDTFEDLIEEAMVKSNYDDFDILISGAYDYRLRMTDKNGIVSYSNVISLLVTEEIAYSAEVLPNPIKDQAQIELQLSRSTNVSWNIMDDHGRLLKKSNQNNSLDAGQHYLELDAYDLTTGTYILNVIFDNKIISKRIVIIE